MNDDAAEAEQGDEVWYRHQGIHAVGDIPYQSEADDTAQEDTHNIQHAIDEHPALALEILYAAFAIIAPSQGGAEGEGGEADGEQWGSYVWYLAEGCLGERCAIMVVDIRIGDDAGGDDQSREGTDDDGIPEGSGRGYQRLAYRIAGLGGGSYDRCRTESRLVGEESAGDTIAGCYMRVLPAKPPPAARVVKADSKITFRAGRR